MNFLFVVFHQIVEYLQGIQAQNFSAIGTVEIHPPAEENIRRKFAIEGLLQ